MDDGGNAASPPWVAEPSSEGGVIFGTVAARLLKGGKLTLPPDISPFWGASSVPLPLQPSNTMAKPIQIRVRVFFKMLARFFIRVRTVG